MLFPKGQIYEFVLCKRPMYWFCSFTTTVVRRTAALLSILSLQSPQSTRLSLLSISLATRYCANFTRAARTSRTVYVVSKISSESTQTCSSRFPPDAKLSLPSKLPLLEESTIVGLSSRKSAPSRLEKVSSGWESISESYPLSLVISGIRLRLCGRDARRWSLGLISSRISSSLIPFRRFSGISALASLSREEPGS